MIWLCYAIENNHSIELKGLTARETLSTASARRLIEEDHNDLNRIPLQILNLLTILIQSIAQRLSMLLPLHRQLVQEVPMRGILPPLLLPVTNGTMREEDILEKFNGCRIVRNEYKNIGIRVELL